MTEYIGYSKKVMEHFKNPHNMGKMKNPDAVGKVGNIVCLPSGSEIQENPFLFPIEKIKLESKVLSHDGKYHKVSKKFLRNYNGILTKVGGRLGITKLTPEHLVKAIKLLPGDKYLRIKNKRKLIPAWYHAAELRKNDILLYPIPKIVKDIKKIKVDNSKLKYDFKSKGIPKSINVDGEFLRLVGYFLAEGNTNMKVTSVCTTFTFGYHEKEYINDVAYLLKKIFKVEPKTKELKHKNTTVIRVDNVHLTRFFNKLFGNDCENKNIPEFMMFLPIEKQNELIKGLWRGDGFVNPKIPRTGFSTVSYKLAQQLKFLLIRQKIIPSFYTEEAKVKKGVHHKRCYRIHVGSWSVRKLVKILDVSLKEKEITNDSWADDKYIYYPITSLSRELYKGKVHNLEVNETHSFTTDSILVHNCGDVMWIYLKVKDNIIKDIKFQTFGCVAAISTSSMVTDLAKGKTIEQALKIRKDNIVEKLGGLPNIKIHCSMLAIDALHEAIYIYLKNNKQKIPAELEKEHERILKTLNKIGK